MSMASEPIHVNDDSELPRLVDEASERPVRFVRKGVVYRLTVDDAKEDLWANYDPEAVRAAVREATGAIPGDADEIIERLYEARRVGSRPMTRP
jgi:hypothetical protein